MGVLNAGDDRLGRATLPLRFSRGSWLGVRDTDLDGVEDFRMLLVLGSPFLPNLMGCDCLEREGTSDFEMVGMGAIVFVVVA